MSKEKFAGVKGMNDMLPADAAVWQTLQQTAVGVLERYGYQEIRTPILENTKVFTRGVGEVTDIVEKEMYSFTDSMNGDQLTLRPECTSAVVRSVNEHSLLYGATQRLWYCGPMFRHERPQRGRYRQFHQLGAEALGMEGPDIDAEMIMMLARIWKELGVGDVRLELNTLGALPERQAHREALIKYFEGNQRTPAAVSTRIRCAFSTRRTPRCRSSSTLLRVCSTSSVRKAAPSSPAWSSSSPPPASST